MICPTCYQRCYVLPSETTRNVFFRHPDGLLLVRTYTCRDCAEEYSFAQGGPPSAESETEDVTWH